MRTESDIIKEKLEPLRCEKAVQFGFLNAQVTRTLADFCSVDFYTTMKFNPFEDDPSIKFFELKQNPAHLFRKYKKIDCAYLGRISDFISTRIALGAFGSIVRSGGYIFIVTEKGNQPVKEAVEEYKNIFEEGFDLEIEEISDTDIFISLKAL